ncbi:hypothetical protein MLD38_026975 [Melastoma candidum]|uniref:Uncharacterized protein n=1 Tax=Melastoma candidum TaxID=119954 RepID=A0ACB9P1A5_9MYRT|nr:hypothetical protein MLD38_026975 [Melastoma candidum]
MKTPTPPQQQQQQQLILFHHPKQPHSRLFILFFLSFFTFAFLFTLLSTSAPSQTQAAAASSNPIPAALSSALLHYASSNSTLSPPHLSLPELSSFLSSLLPCSPSCNLLVFGITHESLLFSSLNHAGLSVFLDESEPLSTRLERDSPPGTRLEAYDLSYTTRVSHLPRLLRIAREESSGECRPVQDLLFSECPVAINDLPNHLYHVPWDVILIDGPRGYDDDSPGRMSAVFTAAVLARSKGSGDRPTQVMVHECEREVERVSSEEFLCAENLVEKVGSLARFSVPPAEAGSWAFCRQRGNETASLEEEDDGEE